MKKVILSLILICSTLFVFAQNNYLDWQAASQIRKAVDPRWEGASATISQNAVYAWTDLSSGSRDVYAQMKNPQGNNIWGTSPLVICHDDYTKENLRIVTTSDNCVILSWTSRSKFAPSQCKLSAQKINSNGQILWQTSGIEITSASGSVSQVSLLSDDQGGAYTFYCSSDSSIYSTNGQHLNSSGELLWGINGHTLFNNTTNFSICKDNSGGFFFSYCSSTNQISYNHLNSNADFLWEPAVLTNTASSYSTAEIVSDNQNGFYAVWADLRNSYHIYAQHINSSGTITWNQDCNISENLSGTNFYPEIVSISSGEAFIAFINTADSPQYQKVVLRKINIEGNLLNVNVNLFDNSYYVIQNAILTQKNDLVYLAFMAYNNSYTSTSFACQRFNADGSAPWLPNGLFFRQTPYCSPNRLSFTPSNDNIFLTWMENFNKKDNITTQVMDLNGNQLLPVNSSVLDSGISGSSHLQKVVNYDNYSFICWTDSRDLQSGGIYLQKLDSNGNQLFQTDGKLILENGVNFLDAQKNTFGGVTVFYTVSEEANLVCKAQCFDNNGNALWDPNGLTYLNFPYLMDPQFLITNDPNTNDYAIFFMKCDPEYNTEIRVQRIVNSQPLWGYEGKLIYTDLFIIALKKYSNNCLIFTSAGENYYSQYKAFKLDENCDIVPDWPAQGLLIMNTDLGITMQETPVGLLFASCQGTNITLQILNNAGQLTFPENGYPLQMDYPFSYINWNDGLELYYYIGNPLVVRKWAFQNNQLSPLWNSEYRLVYTALPQTTYDFKFTNMETNTLISFISIDQTNYSRNLNFKVLDRWGSILGDPNGCPVSGPCFDMYDYQVSPINAVTAYIGWVDAGISSYNESKCPDYPTYHNLYMQKLNLTALSNSDPNNSPLAVKLFNNYPNPFNPSTKISFSLPQNSHAKLDVFNIKGQLIKSLINDNLTQGLHEVVWNGTDSNGKKTSSGIYFYKLSTKNKTLTKKMLMLK